MNGRTNTTLKLLLPINFTQRHRFTPVSSCITTLCEIKVITWGVIQKASEIICDVNKRVKQVITVYKRVKQVITVYV